MPPKRPASHAERAAALLKRARSVPHTTDSADAQTIPLPRLLHALHTMAHVPVAEAMAIVRTLVAKQRHTRGHLRRISAPELEHIGAPCTGATRDRVVQVLQGLGRADEAGGLTEAERASQQQRLREEVQLRREWGNAPKDTKSDDESDDVFDFHAVLDESALRGRHVMVNRAPVMTAWAVVVLQCLGFRVQEALSLAHCYVSTTAEMRAQTLGKSAPAHVTSTNQPHVDFLQVRIPVIQLRQGQYRGLHAGEVVPPTRAFDYLRRSMFQMLPHVMGALTLLANAYMGPTNDTESLQRHAYALYVDFRPDTQGAWGKRATLSLDTILGLRQGAVASPSTETGKVDQATEHA
ncbi:hypothetical protein MCAP1_001604 [Malassezia caprae]|uniref:Uncharacterized protein n=1 Tax=Malassezia caprae TaxID=1381934 RepID=A0AAF0IV32_9BASI|nr:hypothetical protein MCAP1_001604 [Malassezia caprae]